MARQDCTAGVAAAELPLGLQHSPCGALEGVVVDRLAVAAERPGSRQRRHSRDDDGDGKASREKQVRFRVDGDRVVDVHFIEGSVHARGFMMVYLPREKLLIEADAFTPGPPGAPPPATPNALHVNLVQNIERLNLQVDRILPLHGRVVPVSELYAAIGRKN